jgi:hypothetical protein
MHIVIAGLHRMVYMEFNARRINMSMSLNGTKHMYIVTAIVHMMFYRLCA